MKKWIQILLLSFGCLGVLSTVVEAQEDAEAYEELTEWETVSEIMRHLYRWYLDSSDLEPVAGVEEVTYYVTPLNPMLDEGDESLFAELYLPLVGVLVHLKKTDYSLEELSIQVESDSFKITNVEKVGAEHSVGEDAIESSFPFGEMRDYLFETRFQQDTPSVELLRRLEVAARGHLEREVDSIPGDEDLTIYVSPLSPVTNRIWLFWEDANLLIHWDSDIDIAAPAVWEHEQLSVGVIDIEEQAVLSLSDAPGSNAFMTRDQVGRILYNCIVLGQKRLVPRSAL